MNEIDKIENKLSKRDRKYAEWVSKPEDLAGDPYHNDGDDEDVPKLRPTRRPFHEIVMEKDAEDAGLTKVPPTTLRQMEDDMTEDLDKYQQGEITLDKMLKGQERANDFIVQRHHPITGDRTIHCHWCGALIEEARRGRSKRYCDDACKQAAYRARRSQVAGTPEYERTRRQRLAMLGHLAGDDGLVTIGFLRGGQYESVLRNAPYRGG